MTASVTNPWRRADRTPAVDSVSFAQTVCPEPTATVDAAWSWSTLQADGVSVRGDRDRVVTGRVRRRLEHPGEVRCLNSDGGPANRPARHGVGDETVDPSVRSGGAGEGRREDERGDSECTNSDPTRDPTVVGARGGHGEHAPGQAPAAPVRRVRVS